ncbi:MAG TPA: DMT family transporter [Gemmatimonadales bacterium]|nr:DMT family transporter [Gemmatimonadales bacterium]
MRRPFSPHLGMVLTTLIWGANYTVVKLAIREIPPFPFTAIRFAAGSLVLGAVLALGGRLRRPPPGLLLRLIVLGVTGNTCYQLCFISGLARTSATNSALILGSLPAMVAVSAGVLGLEHHSSRQRWGILFATLGVIAVVLGRRGPVGGASHLGDGLMLAATGCWTAYSLGMRRLSGRMPPLELTAWTLFTGTPGLVLAALPGFVGMQWGAVSTAAWGGVAYSAVLSLTVAYVLWSVGIRALGAGRTAIYSCGVPLVAATIAMLFLGERPNLAHALGAALIVGGVLLTTLPETVVGPTTSVREPAGRPAPPAEPSPGADAG